MIEVNVTDREGRQRTYEGQPLYTLMEILRDGGAGIEAICGGGCACATCHVIIDLATAAKLPAPSNEEVELLRESQSYDPMCSRLSCQVLLRNEIERMSVTLVPDE